MNLDRKYPEGKRPANLSGLFLTSVSDEYRHAKNKVMIIGRETRDWNILKQKEEFTNLNDYIQISMNKHQEFFKFQLEKRKNIKGNAFYSFTRSVANKCGKKGLIYSNLFCFAWKKGSPIHCEYFENIKKNSERHYSSEGIANKHLWEFVLNTDIRCFRIHHPSAPAKEAVKARKYLINLLPSL